MTDDLVKRLREVKDWWREPGRTAEQAADRIETLEAALRNAEPFLAYAYQQITEPRNPLPMKVALDAARAALGEKKDD